MRYEKRPKWAKPLLRRHWKQLQVHQHTSRPTLRNLYADVEYQRANGMPCFDCTVTLRIVRKGYLPR